MRTLQKLALTIIFAISALPAPAAVQLVDGSNQLYGALGVDVDGTLYDVLFLDDSCENLFDDCDTVSDFDFSSQSDASAASQALLDQVLLDTTNGLFDTQPQDTLGCGNSGVCLVVTPWGFNVENRVLAAYANNDTVEASDGVVGNGLIDTDFDASTSSLVVYALWVEQSLAVPLPAAAPLYTGALVLLGAFRVRRYR